MSQKDTYWLTIANLFKYTYNYHRLNVITVTPCPYGKTCDFLAFFPNRLGGHTFKPILTQNGLNDAESHKDVPCAIKIFRPNPVGHRFFGRGWGRNIFHKLALVAICLFLLVGWSVCGWSVEWSELWMWLQEVSSRNNKVRTAVQLCKQSISDTSNGPGRPALNSRPLHAVRTPVSDSGVRRLDKKSASSGGKNKRQQAAWK